VPDPMSLKAVYAIRVCLCVCVCLCVQDESNLTMDKVF
jgi:hypothetical protein